MEQHDTEREQYIFRTEFEHIIIAFFSIDTIWIGNEMVSQRIFYMISCVIQLKQFGTKAHQEQSIKRKNSKKEVEHNIITRMEYKAASLTKLAPLLTTQSRTNNRYERAYQINFQRSKSFDICTYWCSYYLK